MTGSRLTRLAGTLVAILAIAAAAWFHNAGGAPQPTGDAAAEEWLQQHARHWLASTPTESGAFRVNLNRYWELVDEPAPTLVSQSRMIFVLANGYAVSRDPAYRDAAVHGADYLLSRFSTDSPGTWHRALNNDGTVADSGFHLYGHAFAVIGLTALYDITDEERYLQAAQATWRQGLADHLDSLRAAVAGVPSGGGAQNATMHVFEALLALNEVSPSPQLWRDIEMMGTFATRHLFQADAGYLPEYFDDEWTPIAPDDGGVIDLGHEFQWAFLLSEGVEAGLPPPYLAVGKRLIRHAVATGIPVPEGGVAGTANYDGTLDRGARSWWAQAEALRALHRYAGRHGESRLWETYEDVRAYVRAEIADPAAGGWFEDGKPLTGRTDDDIKGSSWKCGYHVAGYYREIIGPGRRP